MGDVQCDICCETLPLEGFLFSPCGHGFCETCTQSLETSRQCPSCRKPRMKGELHRIFVSAPEDTQSRAQSLANSMNHLRPDSNPSSAKKVPEGIRRIVEKLEVDANTADNLLKVAKNMEERLVPILFRMQVEQDEKRALQEKVKAWRPKILQVESSASEVAQLKKELEKAERSKQAMARENARLKKELEKAERSKQAMARENARLKEELEKAERSKQVMARESARFTKLLEAETKESEKLRRDVIDERRLVKKQDILIDQLVQEKKNADMQVNLAKKKLKVLAQSSSNRKA